MKKEIMTFLGLKDARMQVSNLIWLKRTTQTSLGNEADKLQVYITGLEGDVEGNYKDIESRDYDGIMKEISEYFKAYMLEFLNRNLSELKNGNGFQPRIENIVYGKNSYMSVEEVANHLGISKSRVYALIDSNKLKTFLYAVERSSVEEYKSSRKPGRPKTQLEIK